MGPLSVIGYGLAVIFVTVSGILANSLRRRVKEVENLTDQLSAKTMEVEDLRKINSKDGARLKDLNNQLSLATIKTASLETKNKSLSAMADQDQVEIKRLKSRLENCYERVGKRFQKVGKV